MPNQNKPHLIGITGGIGSGKSIVCRVFHCLGIPIYDADSRARWLMNNQTSLILDIKKEFGDASYSDGQLDRSYLSKMVFPNPEKLAKLNLITHPVVALDFENWIAANSESKYLIKEAAILIESGAYKQLDKLILVTAPENIRIERVLKRDPQRTEADVIQLIKRQMPEDEKMRFCDYIIKNDNSERILSQILPLHSIFYS